MAQHVDAIFSHGAFRPVEPLVLPEGTRVHLSVEEGATADPLPLAGAIRTPKLARPSDAADFVLSMREADDEGV